MLGLLAVEASLQIVTAVSPKFRRLVGLERLPPSIRLDPQLDVLPNREHPEHDERGFRNPSRVTTSSIVVFGDSQTYGVSVGTDQSWPSVLRTKHGLDAYSMAMVGWGPGHYLLYLDEALRLDPRTIVVALYDGNDLYDVFRLVYVRGLFPELRDHAEQELAIEAVEASEPYQEIIERLIAGSIRDPGPQTLPYGPRSPTSTQSIKRWLVRHVMVMRIAHRFRAALRDGMLKSDESRWRDLLARCPDPDHRLPVDVDGVRTVLTPSYRLSALNLEDPRIREGLRLSGVILRLIQSRCRDAGVDLRVVMLPTKELVFAPLTTGSSSEVLARLVGFEEEVRYRLQSEMTAAGIPWIDLLPALRGTIRTGTNPYNLDWDGHPSAAGNRVTAQAVTNELASRASFQRPREIQ